MKRIILFVIFVALIGGSTMNLLIYIPPMGELNRHGVPLHYYDRRCMIPLGMPVETWLTAMKWPRPFQIHVWDCSQTSAYTEWALENCGYRAEIVTIRVERLDRLWGHAYVRVKIDSVWHSYETTSRRRLTPKDLALFVGPEVVYGSIYTCQWFMWDKAVFAREWNWWKPIPQCTRTDQRQGEAR